MITIWNMRAFADQLAKEAEEAANKRDMGGGTR